MYIYGTVANYKIECFVKNINYNVLLFLKK
jgi:hypothetical protein